MQTLNILARWHLHLIRTKPMLYLITMGRVIVIIYLFLSRKVIQFTPILQVFAPAAYLNHSVYFTWLSYIFFSCMKLFNVFTRKNVNDLPKFFKSLTRHTARKIRNFNVKNHVLINKILIIFVVFCQFGRIYFVLCNVVFPPF